MIQRKISSNKDIPQLIVAVDAELGEPHGAYAALLYTWCISHLDREGRMHGDPFVVKGEVFPRLPGITADHCERYLIAMSIIGLVAYYEAEGDRWLAFRGFVAAQVGLRKERETASRVPPASEGSPIAGAMPEQCRSNAGAMPELVPHNRREEKRREEKECVIAGAPEHAPSMGDETSQSPPPPTFTANGFANAWETATGTAAQTDMQLREELARLCIKSAALSQVQVGGHVVTVLNEFQSMLSDWRGKGVEAYCDMKTLLRNFSKVEDRIRGAKVTPKDKANGKKSLFREPRPHVEKSGYEKL